LTNGDHETLPIWIFTNYSRPNQLPIVNVVGLGAVLLSIIPVFLANRVSKGAAAAIGGGP
jgi:putative spermidine/putrescine transport system permease protein